MTDIVSQEQQLNIATLRAASRERPLTREELKHALALIRGDRQRASITSSASKSKKAAAGANIDSDALLDQLGGLE